MKALLAVAGVVLAIAACSQPASKAQRDDSEILQARDFELQKAVAAKDLPTIMSYYAEDAVLMPAAEPLISGKAAIENEWEHILNIPEMQNTSELLRVEASPGSELAYTMGSYQSRMMGENGELVTEPGKWLSVWRRQPDGQWLIVVDTYNTDIPPPDHK